ncbi:Medium-chain fatty acid ethyl ester synthase/esterase 2 [Sesamum angolense]|uniref:Medium-chain fatty acid ethyl ester synthase/esterase 2 n=1 Tax=Sesamum angolense TaxID=2727404 RepID=A0AAE1WNW0_9LAMI|nr:Medium-chain fatty acid ethyl ester synthase/esterase 2 [Sesamum angolense]
MSLAFGQTQFLLPPSVLHRRAIPSRPHDSAWKRRRLKPLTVLNRLNPPSSPFDDLFHSLLSQFPSLNSINYIAPTLGLASGLALFISSSSRKLLPNPETTGDSNSDIGEWILFTSPTPFNRFVTLRCPSIFFPGNEFLEDVNEKLIKEERHYVKLNNGRMICPVKSGGDVDENMVFQRICVATADGGVLSLDWPSNLDLEEERGLDTTVLIVPGTAEGSIERKIRVFVCECLRRGVFPVVMNPRGCAGSPLTTARLFTAADSDDISTAVQFISKKRPWTTLMGVGWEYGANMLTKYLAESGERTPLTAATCIDNPFDLEEATRSAVHHMDFDQRHTDGLINILQCNKNTETDGTPNVPLKGKENSKEPSELDEMSEKTQQNIVTSLAEKAMSVASPVVPVKEDGEVDHERLVAMLAELGQKGGILRLVGKVALLWGGIRGAMSLTDKLISFLRIAERPFFQRILGFVFMVMLLWSPVVLPLLPTLMQSWTTRNPFKIAEFACIAGLYVSIMIMVTLWGKRIRKYDDPLVQYGLDLASVSKLNVLICDLNLWIVADGDEKCPYAFGLDVQRSKNCSVLGAYGGILLGLLCLNPGPCRSLSPTTTTSHVPQRDGSGGKRWFQGFLKGLVGGVVLVILIHAVNTALGCAHLCWPTTLSSSYSEPVSLIKSYGWMLMLIVQGIATVTGVSVVEELLFRSWLPQEIAADFGYHHGIVISGLVFALSQRSIWEIPGLWLLSLSLSGARQRSQGSLSLPIGLRTGILVSNFILRTGGFLTYQPNFPLWLTGGRPFQPFSGVVGLAFSLVLAVILYPRQPLYRERITRVIRE